MEVPGMFPAAILEVQRTSPSVLQENPPLTPALVVPPPLNPAVNDVPPPYILPLPWAPSFFIFLFFLGGARLLTRLPCQPRQRRHPGAADPFLNSSQMPGLLWELGEVGRREDAVKEGTRPWACVQRVGTASMVGPGSGGTSTLLNLRGVDLNASLSV